MWSARIVITSLSTVLVGSAGPLIAQPPPSSRPCDQITAACTAAGFVQGAGPGTGLQIDCVIPIIQGSPQPADAARPLPRVAPEVVAACRARNPDFGHAPISTGLAPPTANVKPPTVTPAAVPDAAVQSPQATAGAARQFPPVADSQVVYDSRLNIWWLADGNLAAKETFGVSGINKSGSMDYQTAVHWVQALNAFNNRGGYLGHNDWQLPTAPQNDPHCDRTGTQGESFGFHCSSSALGSLYYNTFGLQEPNTAVPIPGNTVGPFSNFQPYLYWSKSPAAIASQGFVSFSFNTGFQGANVGRNHLYVLPMIKGKLPSATPSAGGTRLAVNPGGQTVYDPVSQITWLADANLAAKQTFGVTGISIDGSMDHATAISWIDAMNKADHGRGYLGHNNWDLPETGPTDPSCSIKGTTGFGCTGSPMGHLYYSELGFLRGQPVTSTPDIRLGPFRDIQPYLYWACEASSPRSPCQTEGPATGFEWNFSFGSGFEGTNLVQNYLYVIVYFPGPVTPIKKGPAVLRP